MKRNNCKSNCMITFLIAMFICLSLGACGTAKESNPKSSENKNISNQEQQVKIPTENTELHKRAEKIVEEISKIKGVNKAYVVISNKNALVGLNIDKSYEGKLTDELRKKVEDTVKNTDKNIERVATTADADLTKRIENLGNDVKTGKPFSGLGTEIEEIFNRIIPR